MLTIGEVAALARTTVRAVRHYHAIGLVAEPGRDRSGYRRYGATELVRLLRIRGMRELGLSLDRIATLLDGPEEGLDDALDALDAELAAHAERVAAQRARLAVLRASRSDPELPEPLGTIFAKALADGMPARAVQQEKEVVMLDLALHPQNADAIAAEYGDLYASTAADPRLPELARRFDALADAAADDPAVAEVAAEFADVIAVVTDLTPRDDEPYPITLRVFASWSEGLPPAQRAVTEKVAALLGLG